VSAAGLAVRPATRDDAAFVLETARRLASFELPAGRSAAEIVGGEARTLRAFFEAPPSGTRLLVAEADGRPAGFAYLEPLTDYFTGERHGHVGILAVAAGAEGRGVGKALLSAAEDWARGSGWRKLTLNVLETNRRARGVYERVGFAPESLRYVKWLP
jgi:GNAT superfamily N-acetyltransferase